MQEQVEMLSCSFREQTSILLSPQQLLIKLSSYPVFFESDFMNNRNGRDLHAPDSAPEEIYLFRRYPELSGYIIGCIV